MGDMAGIFAILQTPFLHDASGGLRLDEASLRREVDFCVDAGAHGIVVPVMASEFHVLAGDERRAIAELVVERTQRRRPVVIGVAGINVRTAVALSRHAQDIGADAVIAMPPYIAKKGRAGIFEYYRAIAGAVGLPVFVQNAAPPLGSALPPAFVARLVREIENVQYVKEEVPPSGHSISAVVAACGGEAHGVFGGAGGRYLIEELRRGAAGNMPACQFTDVLVEIYARYRRGDEAGARRLHTLFLPLLNLSVGEGPVMKEVLRRRGIVETTLSRVPRPPLDAHDVAELEQALATVSSHFKVHPPLRTTQSWPGRNPAV